MDEKVLISKSILSGIAESLRVKMSTTETFAPVRMSSAILDIPTGEVDMTLPQIMDKTISSITNSYITTVKETAFSGCGRLTYVDLPNCSAIGSSAFNACHELRYVNIPNAQYINQSAFYWDYWLGPDLSFPECTRISPSAFCLCSRIESIYLPVVNTIDTCAFDRCSALKNIYAPKCTRTGNNAFSGCTSLKSVTLEGVGLSLANGTFYNCTNLEEFYGPNLLSIGQQAFYSCFKLSILSVPNCIYCYGPFDLNMSSLKELELPKISSIQYLSNYYIERIRLGSTNLSFGAYCLRYCSRLTRLEFPNIQTVPRFGTGMFIGTAMENSTWAGKFGSIYVPASLVDTMRAATSWSAFADRITAFEE